MKTVYINLNMVKNIRVKAEPHEVNYIHYWHRGKNKLMIRKNI